jgi:predicted dehydrogenase
MLQQTISLAIDHAAHPARRVRIALAGLGSWAPTVLRVLGQSPDADVRWICDLDTSRLAKYRHRHPEARVTTRFDRVLADPGVDAIILATPVDTHYELAMDALEVGKHVFVKSPLATAAELADDLAAVARRQRRIAISGQTFLYSPEVRAVKRMIETDTLGDIHCISSTRANLELDRRAGSVIWDLGPHDFSILLYWTGELPTSVRVVGRESMLGDVPDIAFIAMSFPSGIIANVELSWLSPSNLGRTVVVGSERTAVYEEGGPNPVRLLQGEASDQTVHPFGEHRRTRRRGDVASPHVEHCDPLELQLRDFLAAIRVGELMVDQTTMAQSVVRIAAAADESLRLGGAEVSLTGDEFTGGQAPRGGLAAV